jgi:hypothetical protein
MKNNFDLKGYMKQNQVGSYQQLNEMWYQDINQALGDFNEAVVIDSLNEEDEMEEAAGGENLKVSLDYADYPSISDAEQKMAINQFMKLVKSLGGNATKTGDKFSTIDFEITGGPSFEELQAAYDKQGEDMFASVLASWKLNKSDLEEMGGVKNIGDKAKLATPNTRPNLGRHRSSDMLDKMSKKDHDKNTVVGAKAAAYKAPHMKEEETADDIFAGSEDANWDNYGNETSEWDTEIAGQTVNGWTAEETQGGAIAWQNPKYPNAHIYATPGWEGVDGIAFELHDSEDGYMDEPKIQKVIGSGTEAWKTKAGYMALMAKAFTVVEKMLIPFDNMDEDHGTQVNHDMNDDISMDYTEPEHMVQNEGVQDWNHTWEEDIADLLDDGVSKPEILTHFKDILKNADSRMEESIEDEDPFGSIKTGIDKITQDDDEDFIDDDKLDRFYDMGGRQLTKAADALLDDGFSKREIIDYLQNYM